VGYISADICSGPSESRVEHRPLESEAARVQAWSDQVEKADEGFSISSQGRPPDLLRRSCYGDPSLDCDRGGPARRESGPEADFNGV